MIFIIIIYKFYEIFLIQGDEKYVDLTIMFTKTEESEEIIKGTPTVRIFF